MLSLPVIFLSAEIHGQTENGNDSKLKISLNKEFSAILRSIRGVRLVKATYLP